MRTAATTWNSSFSVGPTRRRLPRSETPLRVRGLDVSQALVTEVATQALAGALLGGTGGGVAGATTEDPAAMFFLGALGLIVGAAVGHTREVITAQFNAYRAYPVGTWTFQRLDQVPAPQAAW